MFRIILRAGVLALPLMVAACNQTSPVADAALNLGTQFDPTGLSGTAIGMAQSLQPASSEAENDGDSFDLSQIAPRLRDVAAGRTARPNIMKAARDQMDQIMALQALSLASSITDAAVSGALSGGASLAASAPSLAMQAATTGMVMSQAGAAKGQIRTAAAKAEAERAADRVIPDADRPAEARAILSIVNGPSGSRATWQNPQTGASGQVTIQSVNKDAPDDVVCRLVKQEWRKGNLTRSGSIAICESAGEWYDLS